MNIAQTSPSRLTRHAADGAEGNERAAADAWPLDGGGETEMHSQLSKAATLFVSVILATSVTAVVGPRQESPQIDIREARKHVRKNVTVCGKVTTHRCPRPKRTTYLDLETPYWSGGVSVAIPAGRRQAFGARVEDQYAFPNCLRIWSGRARRASLCGNRVAAV